jgi:dTDP-L-rhamnose 4-epimerase
MRIPPKKILISGGAGFIGSRLALKCINEGHEVTVFDNLSKQIHGENPNINSNSFRSLLNIPNLNICIGDVRDLNIWKELISDCDVIYHLAAETGTGQSMYEIERYSEVNVHATSLMFQAINDIKENRIEKIIYASSRAIYGEGKYKDSNGKLFYPCSRNLEFLKNGDFKVYSDGRILEPLPTSEDSLIQPSSFYGLTKSFQESMIHLLSKNYNIVPISLRLQNVYGEGQSLHNPYTGILSIFSNMLKANKEINIFEDGKESRDFIHVDDVVQGFYLMLSDKINAERIYNLGTGVATDVLSIAEKLKKLLKSNSKIKISGAFRVGDIRHNFADMRKIEDEFNFKATINIDEGLQRFSKWVLKEEILKSNFIDSIQEMKNSGLYYEG